MENITCKKPLSQVGEAIDDFRARIYANLPLTGWMWLRPYFLGEWEQLIIRLEGREADINSKFVCRLEEMIKAFDKRKPNYSGADVRKVIRKLLEECDIT